MPGFRTHTTINLAALGGLAVAGVWEKHVSPTQAAIGAASFVVATVFLSPDLDLRHSSPTRNWGPLRWLWRPYQMVFKHRGVSHSVLLSSVTRIVYLLAVVFAACFAASWFVANQRLAIPPSLGDDLWAYRAELGAAGAGIFLSDVTHIVADRTLSALKVLVGF